ncbi:expressed unknown protein [Seminavis robusta]|uniref:F-box domain-containing protein n=1 Tax=Seminavis robusta TaxID=568900 RepID=A0A9N8H7Z7_9STRA|nr:expressed unknown protein [Seminavis robusta]|eukprot:Sro199_g084420.1 n/a (367) ;mRNA; r:58133-59233
MEMMLSGSSSGAMATEELVDQKPAAALIAVPSSMVNMFLQLPREILCHIYTFMDVPMLGSMAQTHTGILRELATADETWSDLVHRRFQIATTKRPKAFGGKDWKDAYCSMNLCNRMPKSRWTNRKAIFAKGNGRMIHATGSGTTTGTTSSLSLWVTLNHTENCRTRILRTNASSSNRQRHVDLWVCLQNVQSNGPPIQVHIMQSELHFLGGLGNVYTERCIQEQLSCGYRWLVPRLLHHRHHHHSPALDRNVKGVARAPTTARVFDLSNDLSSNGKGVIVLQPLEFCIVSLPFACGQDAFETDALARTVSLRVPFDSRPQIGSTPLSSEPGEAQAWFVPESDVWDQYCQLPGGCLTLSDKERRMHL